MKMWRVAAVVVVILSALCPIPAASQTVGLYDNFNSGVLDPARWLGYQYATPGTTRRWWYYGLEDWYGSGFDEPEIGDSMRRVVAGQAQIQLTSIRRHGPRPDPGLRGYSYGGTARSGLRINHRALADHAPEVRTFRSTVTVVDAVVPEMGPGMFCEKQSGGYGSVASAGLFGHFFNDGTSPSGGLTGDVFASLKLYRQVWSTPSGPMVANVVQALIGRCEAIEPDCTRIKDISAATFEIAWRTDVAYVLTIAWQPRADTFTFTVDGDGTTESRTVAYTVADLTPARAYAYDLRVEGIPMRCEQDGEAVVQRIFMDARFDNVHLDAAAAAATR
jgi:hypothetical protein